MELNETSAQRVNDVYSELAAISASDTEQISTAMSKVASLAHSANMEFETTAAFLTQIIETTQEAPETAKRNWLREFNGWELQLENQPPILVQRLSHRRVSNDKVLRRKA